MIKGSTESGFEFEIEESVFEDWRFVSALSELAELEMMIMQKKSCLSMS